MRRGVAAQKRWIVETARASRCPYCGSEDTERNAAFGPFHMAESYSCRACLSPFSRIRWGDDSEPGKPAAG